jgi:nickel/cobalt exporter
MTSFADLLQQNAGNAWLFIPSAILLGALHGLEPGHSKTMMAAFIIAIRGTIWQAIMLGLAATLSHTAVVWAVALVGLHFGQDFGNERTEAYFQLGSAVLIIGFAIWMFWRTWREQQSEHDHDHGNDEVRTVNVGTGTAQLEIYESGQPPKFRFTIDQNAQSNLLNAATVSVMTMRPSGATQLFRFKPQDGFLESIDAIPEPHTFNAQLTFIYDQGAKSFPLEFAEHDHGHAHADDTGIALAATGYQDAHERAHASDIRRRFANRQVTNTQILLFGLTGGLVPCPASITVLLLCLQLKRYTLGVTLVLCFSIGLALTMVATGVIAALSMRAASKRFSGFGEIARKAPYVSSVLITLVGLYTGYLGLQGIQS